MRMGWSTLGVLLTVGVFISSTDGLNCWTKGCPGEHAHNCRQESMDCRSDSVKFCYTQYFEPNGVGELVPLNGCLFPDRYDKLKLSANECTQVIEGKRLVLWCVCNENDCNTLKYGMDKPAYKNWANKVEDKKAEDKKNGDKKGEKSVAPLGNFLSGPLLLAALFLLLLF